MSKLFMAIAVRLAVTKTGAEALSLTEAPLVFRSKPTIKVKSGLVLIALSYILGWPAVAACGALAIYFRKPLILAIGGPGFYGFSWVIWLVGMFLLGAESYKIGKLYGRYLLKRFIERYGSQKEKKSSEAESDSSSSNSNSRE